jgi:predicted  nucleic acid-binding Zn-ribbon protein
MALTEDWLESEIEKLERELTGAKSRLADAVYSLGRARAEYRAAKETVETTEGVIWGLRNELELLNPPRQQ